MSRRERQPITCRSDALENRRYTRPDHISSELFGIQTPAQKSAPIPKDERAFFRSCDAG
jgi:hypothetical protein